MSDSFDQNKPSRSGFITNYPDFRYWKSHNVESIAQPLNVYVHIPFCIQKCAYCYYFTLKYQGKDQVDKYVDALCNEITLKSEALRLQNRKLNSLYFGGGTPSLLREEQFLKIKACLESNFLMDDFEFTIEAEPHTITDQKIKLFNNLGINRISLGVQSFCDEVIKLSDRKHSKQKALDVINKILDKGQQVLNVDLLSGLAGDTLESWGSSIDTALSCGAHNITIYKMEAYSNTLFFDSGVRKNEISLPSDEQELEFMKLAIDRIGGSNYTPWSTFTFIKDGKYAHDYINNIWHGADLCSFGPSSYSKVGLYCHQNTNSYKNYFTKIEAKELPINRGFNLNSKDEQVQSILLSFKFCNFDRQWFCKKHGFDLYIVLKNDLDKLVDDDYIAIDASTIKLTPKGILYGDYVGKRIAHAFKAFLGQDDFNLD